jgi:hypothetical protein
LTYQPQPIDTSGITLTDDILALQELLARNTHDIWACQRIAEGWRHGPNRDDHQKRHPCLVPYEELPDSEREYDRAVSLATLKAILALGYRIEKARPPA